MTKNKLKKLKYTFKNKGIKGVFYSFFRWFNNRTKIILKIKDPIQKRREFLSNKIFKKFKGVVKYGPFKGLKLSEKVWWSHTDMGSILFGFYEKEILEEVLKTSINKEKKNFIDIGAADGYYAIGVLKSNLYDHSYCFELTKKGREVIKENSILNNVFKKISIHGEVDTLLSNYLPFYILNNSLILIDIEGHEFNLLSLEFLKEIKYAKVIIEIHEYFHEDGVRMLEELKKKLKIFFEIKEITTQQRNLAPFIELDNFSDSDRWLLCSEGRYKKGKWLILNPKENNDEIIMPKD